MAESLLLDGDARPFAGDAVTDSDRLAALENKMQELEAMVTLALRLLSVEKPVVALLERYGATDSETHAVQQLLDDLSRRLDKGEMYRPSFGGFVNELGDRFPAIRGNREFVSVLIDTLRVDRPVYRKLHEFMAANGWPQ
jgi:hypothetical protein